MQLKISEKNSKIGRIPNLSLTPGTSCVPGIPCYDEGCYAKNAYDRWPNVEQAWDSNLKFYQEDPKEFFKELRDWIEVRSPDRFRLFVGGDFPDESFYQEMNRLALNFPFTTFLAFTKRYDYDFNRLAANFKIILSCWPGVPLPENTDLPWSWLKEDSRRPEEDSYVCPGGCDDCGHACWDWIDAGTSIVFKKH